MFNDVKRWAELIFHKTQNAEVDFKTLFNGERGCGIQNSRNKLLNVDRGGKKN